DRTIEADPSFSFIVVSPAGEDVSPKAPQINLSSSGDFIRLDPGQSTEVKFNLSQFCKFEEMGSYRIVAKRLISYWPGKSNKVRNGFQLVSNPLSVSIFSAGH